MRRAAIVHQKVRDEVVIASAVELGQYQVMRNAIVSILEVCLNGHSFRVNFCGLASCVDDLLSPSPDSD